MSNRCTDPFSLTTAPAGNKVARRFPWWQSGMHRFVTATNPLTTGDTFRFRGAAPRNQYDVGRAPLFNNPHSWPIHITEIRWFVHEYFTAAHTILEAEQDTLRKIGVKFSTPTLGQIVADLLPITALDTVPFYGQEMSNAGASITLPADYFLPSTAFFQVDLDGLYGVGVDAVPTAQVGIRGCDPHNGTPLARFSERGNANSAGSKQGNEFILQGDSGQGIRNMWMRDITVNIDADFIGNASYGNYWHNIVAKVTSPQGPKWTDDPFTPLSLLIDQSPCIQSGSAAEWSLGQRNNVVVHRPVTPYILNPQDRMDMECYVPWAPASGDNNATEQVFWCAVKGWQEVPEDAL